MSKARELSQLGDKIDIDDTTGDFAVDTDTLYVDVSAGKVGIGTTTPTGNTNASAVVLEVNSTGANPPEILAGGQNAEISIAGGSGASYLWSTGAYPLLIATNATERMRIDNSGNVLVSATTTSGFQSSSSESGSIIYAAGSIASNSPSNDVAAVFNRLGTDGTIVQLKKDGSTVGQLQSDFGSLILTAASDVRIINANGDGFRTGTASGALALICLNSSADSDGQGDIGLSSLRWNDIFATNGTIQTSDEREKQQIASLTDAEMTAAKAISKLFKTFKWNDSVAENGDNARTHTGVIAQQVETAMSDAGLTASNYAFWCSDTWWETYTEVAAVEAVEAQDAVYDDDGNLVSEAVEAVEAQDAYTRTDQYYTLEEAPEGATERNRKGIRYPELLSFIGAATEQRLTSIEARLDALEA